MNKKSFLFFMFTLSILFLGCSKDDEKQTQSTPTGKLTGKVVVKSGQKSVGGALVFVQDENSKLYMTRTDANGNFSLTAPTGNRKLQIQTGGGANFRTSLAVNVIQDQSVSIPQDQTKLEQVARMAYVSGSYDEIQIVVESLGYDIEMITNTDLTDYSVVAQYDIIFLNCGAKTDNPNQDQIDTNLSNFVTNGGSLYASDWAVAYLTGGSHNSPGCAQSGGFIPDEKLCTSTTGAVTTVAGATVPFSNLSDALGFASLDITYDLGSWETINNFDATFWDVLVNDPISNNALMIKTNHYAGGTILTEVGRNAADEDWITICHHELGSNQAVTITIPVSDWPSHEAHGDSVGECSTTGSSGTIYYTTFHNHAGGNPSSTGPILQYVILNL